VAEERPQPSSSLLSAVYLATSARGGTRGSIGGTRGSIGGIADSSAGSVVGMALSKGVEASTAAEGLMLLP
jgi:hypothetical protein